jgi:hypothetical protein
MWRTSDIIPMKSSPFIVPLTASALLLCAVACNAATIAPAARAKERPAASFTLIDQALATSALRANSQRIARLYLESARSHRPERTRVAMERGIEAIESSLGSLGASVLADPKQRRDFDRATASVRDIWAEVKPILLRPYESHHAQPIYDASEQLYIYSSKLTFLMEDAMGTEAGYLVDVSGRLQATSERIAKAAIHAIVHRKTGAMVDYATWKQEYIDGYRELVGASVNDDYQRRNLELGRVMWGLFDDIVTNATKSSDNLRILEISKCADGMWEIAAGSRSAYVAMLRQGASRPVLAMPTRRTS